MKAYVSLKPAAHSVSYCYKERKTCARWVEKYFNDCLCNLKDDFSFGFGLISLLAWGVAEVPQIITNFRTKSGHGVSLLFLLTWVAGDIFNLVGCLLEPATLYTISTLVLVFQSLYYDYVRKWWKCRHKSTQVVSHNRQQDVEEERPLNPKATVSGIPIRNTSHSPCVRREFYYTSARSLAGSHTPPFRSDFLRTARSGPSAWALLYHSSSDDDDGTTAPIPTKKAAATATKPMPIPRSVIQGTVIAATASLPIRGTALTELDIGFAGRRLLRVGNVERNAMGQWLGWLMAAIYMGGRIPQIVLNIERGSVEVSSSIT